MSKKIKYLEQQKKQIQNLLQEPNLSKNQKLKFQQQIEELEIQLEYLQRREKLQQKEQEKINNFNKILEFKTDNIIWKKSNKSLMYNLWEGFFKNVHLFNLTQKQNYYELNLLPQKKTFKSLEDVKIISENILKNFQIIDIKNS